MWPKRFISSPCATATTRKISRSSTNISLAIQTLRRLTKSRRLPRRHNFTKETEISAPIKIGERTAQNECRCLGLGIIRSAWAKQLIANAHTVGRGVGPTQSYNSNEE